MSPWKGVTAFVVIEGALILGGWSGVLHGPPAPAEPMVTEIVVGYGPKSHDEIVELWRLESKHTVAHCMLMSQLASGGRYGVINVSCKP